MLHSGEEYDQLVGTPVRKRVWNQRLYQWQTVTCIEIGKTAQGARKERDAPPPPAQAPRLSAEERRRYMLAMLSSGPLTVRMMADRMNISRKRVSELTIQLRETGEIVKVPGVHPPRWTINERVATATGE